jgi:hypothetical protein
MRRDQAGHLDEREQSGETDLVEPEEMCVRTSYEGACLMQGRRFTEPFSDSGSVPISLMRDGDGTPVHLLLVCLNHS